MDSQSYKDIKYLMGLIPEARKKVPPGLCPTMYVTGRYEEDLKIAHRLEEIQERLDNQDPWEWDTEAGY